jgi:hypothetical protein
VPRDQPILASIPQGECSGFDAWQCFSIFTDRVAEDLNVNDGPIRKGVDERRNKIPSQGYAEV